MAQITLNSTGVASNGSLVLQSNGTTTAVTVDASQNVGIGTTSPDTRLDIELAAVTPSNSSYHGIVVGPDSGTTSLGQGVGIGFRLRNTAGGGVGGNGMGAAIYGIQADTGANAGALAFYTRPDASNFTERARFNSTGAFVLAGGTTTANGIGITFPATQNASSNANTLDDYEEGTWTPTLTPSAGSLSGFTSSGQYTKVGRMVYVIGNVYITGAGTASGTMTIGALPFTTLNTTSRPAIPLCREDQSTGLIYGGFVNSNATTLRITTTTGGDPVWLNNYNYSFCFTYQSA
jgi:hypothetical protein